MQVSDQKINRTIGLDVHPDLFSASALAGNGAADAKVQWTHDRVPLVSLESWAAKNLLKGDVLVMEASGNSFAVASRLHELGYTALVLESFQASKIRENYCNNDRSDSRKIARVYLSGLAKIVWQPDAQTRQRREVFFAHRNAVKDSTRCRNRIRTFLNEHCVRLPKGTRLASSSGLATALRLGKWSHMQETLIRDKFEQLWEADARRRRFEQLIASEVTSDPVLRKLLRLMGIRHIAAFAVGAVVGNVHRFASPKKLVGYVGLAPGKKQSGNDPKGKTQPIGNKGRGDLRGILIQSAQNALNHKSSPLHKWGWKLTLKKNRNIAVAAIARKIVVTIWHLLKGHFTQLTEASEHIITKMGKLATAIGAKNLKQQGFKNRNDFINQQIQLLLD